VSAPHDDLTGISQTPAFEDVVESLLRKQVEILERIDDKLETVMKLVVLRLPDPGETVPATQAKGNGE
jgi:hypothetical protein